MVRSKHRDTVRAPFLESVFRRGEETGRRTLSSCGADTPTNTSADPPRQTQAALPYLTSGTVTELSAMLVDRIIYQTSKTKHLTFLLSTGNVSQRKKNSKIIQKLFNVNTGPQF